MYALNKDNVREVTEKCLGDSEFERHGLYALHFMTENIHTSIEIGDSYTTEGRDGISSGWWTIRPDGRILTTAIFSAV